MKKILFFTEFLPYKNSMPGVRIKSILRYLIDKKCKVIYFTALNEDFFKNKFYSRKNKNFELYVCIGKDYRKKTVVLKFLFKVFLTLRIIHYLKNIIRENNLKKIWISTPKIYPLFVMYLMKVLKIIKDLEVILEYRDVWSLNKQLKFIKAKKLFLFNIEKILLRKVDKFIYATELVKKTYVENFSGVNFNINNGLVLCTGYSSYKKNNIDKYKFNYFPHNSEKLTFTYAGSFYQNRDPLFFLNILHSFLKTNNIDYSLKIKVNLIVNYCQEDIYEKVKYVINNNNFENIVNIFFSVSNIKVKQFLKDSDILLLICHEKRHEDALPGKMAEYVGAKKNILAISNDPLVVQAIRNDKLGWVCSHNDKKALFNVLTEIYEKWKRKSLVFKGNYTKYSVDERYKQLDNFLFNQ